MKVEFVTALRAQENYPDNNWILLDELTVIVTDDDGEVSNIVVPPGFATDFCSVPRLPFVFAAYGDIARRAGAVHDWLYTVANRPRDWCDRVLRAAVIACGYSEETAEAFYLAVRAGGASHYASYGWKKDSIDARDHQFALDAPIALPPSIDLRPWCPNIYDQGNLGSCTANAIAAVIHFERMKQRLTPSFIPSRLFIYYNERAMEGTINSDSGAAIRDGIKSVAALGDCPETAIPGFVGWNYRIKDFMVKPSPACYAQALKYKAVQYAKVAQDRASIKQCLAQGYPIVFGFSVYDSFESQAVANNGFVPMPDTKNEKLLGGHAVVAVGYDDVNGRYIVRNSWGKGWGQAGYCTMPYEYLEDANLASDFWTIRLVAA